MVELIFIVENASDDLEAEDVIFAPGSGIRRPFGGQVSREARELAFADAVYIVGQIAGLATAANTIVGLFKLIPKPDTKIMVTLKDAKSGFEVKIEGTNLEDVEKKLEQARSLVEKSAASRT